MSNQKSPRVYLKFMYLAQVVRNLELFPSLNPMEERLLNQLVAHWALDRQLTVLDAMSMCPDMEPNEIYRCLTSLRQKGMIQLEGEHTDQPSRFIVATPLAEKFFDRLEQCMQTASKC